MEIEGKAGGGYGSGSLCWLLCVVVVVMTTILVTLLVEKLRSGQPKWPFFSTFITKNASLDAPNVKGCPKLSLFLDFGHILTFGLKGEIGAL